MRAVFAQRIYVNKPHRHDISTAHGFVDGNLFTCPEHGISVPLANVSYIEHDSAEQVVVKINPVSNLKPAVKKLKPPSSDE